MKSRKKIIDKIIIAIFALIAVRLLLGNFLNSAYIDKGNWKRPVDGKLLCAASGNAVFTINSKTKSESIVKVSDMLQINQLDYSLGVNNINNKAYFVCYDIKDKQRLMAINLNSKSYLFLKDEQFPEKMQNPNQLVMYDGNIFSMKRENDRFIIFEFKPDKNEISKKTYSLQLPNKKFELAAVSKSSFVLSDEDYNLYYIWLNSKPIQFDSGRSPKISEDGRFIVYISESENPELRFEIRKYDSKTQEIKKYLVFKCKNMFDNVFIAFMPSSLPERINKIELVDNSTTAICEIIKWNTADSYLYCVNLENEKTNKLPVDVLRGRWTWVGGIK
jgi:hypothetical protein